MKNLLIATFTTALLFTSLSAYADDAKPATPVVPSAVSAAPEKVEKQVKIAKHNMRKEFREECLKENAGLKGKELHECVKGKFQSRKEAQSGNK